MADKVLPPNRLLGGYFPGDPVSKPPKGSYTPPNIPKFDDFATFIEEQVAFIEKDYTIPSQLKKQLTQDLENAFKVKLTPTKINPLDIPDEFAGDIEEVPGVTMSFDINPIKWAKDPKGQAFDFIKDAIKSSIGYDIKKPFLEGWNFGDLESAVEKKHIWEPLVENGRVGLPGDRGVLLEDWYRRLAEWRMTPSGTNLALGNVTNPATGMPYVDSSDTSTALELGYGFVTEPKKVFEAVKKPWVSAMTDCKAKSTRNNAHSGMQVAFIQAAATEAAADRGIGWSLNTDTLTKLHKKYAGTGFTGSVSLADALEKLQHGEGSVRNIIGTGGNSLLNQLKADISSASADLLSDHSHPLTSFLGSLETSLRGPGAIVTLGGFAENLARGSLDVSRLQGLDKEVALLNLQDRFVRSFNSYGDLFNKKKKGVLPLLTKARLKGESIVSNSDIIAVFDDLKKRTELTQSELSLLSNLLGGDGEVRKLLGVDLSSFLSKTNAVVSNWAGRPVPSLISDLSALHDNYTTNTYNGGLKERIFNRIGNRVFYLGTDTAKYLDTLEGGKRLRWLYVMENNRNRRFAAEDLVKVIDEGPSGLFDLYAWPKLRNKLKKVPVVGAVLFPADFFQEKVLKPVHWFGLVYESGYKDSYEKFKTEHKFLHWLTKSARLDLPEHTFNVSFMVGANKVVKRVTGGDHFKAVGALYKLFGGGDSPLDETQCKQLWTLLTAHPKNIDALISNPLLQGLTFGAMIKKDLEDHLKNSRGFWKWILKNKDYLGLDFSTQQNREASLNKIHQFMRGLEEGKIHRLIDYTQKYIGRLQKLTNKLQLLQNRFFGMVVGKFVRGTVYLKNAIAEGVTQLLIQIAAGLSGGLAEVLEFIEPLIRAVIYKLLSWGEALLKSVIKGDLGGFFKEVEKTFTGVVRYTFVFLIIPFFILMMIFDAFGTMVSAFSPVDNSRTDGEYTDALGVCNGEAFAKISGTKPSPMSEAASYFDAYIRPKINPTVLSAYAYGEEKTRIPCEILLGIHFMEGSNNPGQSLQDGSSIDPSQLSSSAEAAGESMTIALTQQCGASSVESATFEQYICALSYYNGGGGNSQCRHQGTGMTEYTQCPELYPGESDPYVVNWLTISGRSHTNMALIYPADGVTANEFCGARNTEFCGTHPYCNKCPPPFSFDKPGTLTVAILASGNL